MKTQFHDRISFQYYEVWQPQRGTKYAVPIKTYLHLYETRSSLEDPIEIACVHADPCETPKDPDSEWDRRKCNHKKGPHIHIAASDDPLPHCHFPLYLPQLPTVLASVQNLTDAMAEAIELLCHEIADAYQNKT